MDILHNHRHNKLNKIYHFVIAPRHRDTRQQSRQHSSGKGSPDLNPIFESRPNIRFVPVQRESMTSTQPFPVVLHMPGLHSTPIEVDKAYESNEITVHLLSEAVVNKYGVVPDPYDAQIGPYRVTGRIRPDWRRKENQAQNFSTKCEIWLVTPMTLPKGAQALVRSSSPPESSPVSIVSPLEFAKLSSREKKEVEKREKLAKEQRERLAEAQRKEAQEKALEAKRKSKQSKG